MADTGAPAIAPGSRERSSVGPGLVFALSVIGAGDYVSNVAIGVTHGLALLWTLLVASICRFVWVNACARYVLVTGETPFAGFALLSPALVWLLLIALIVHRHVHGLYHVLFMGTSFNLLLPLPTPFSATIWSLAFVAFAFWLMFWAGYRTIERFFKYLMALMGGSLLLVVLSAPPSPAALFKGLFIPSIPESQGAYSTVLLLTALLGTEACSLSNITYSYFMWQKGWRDLTYAARQRWDLLAGIAAMCTMGCLLQVAAAGSTAETAPSSIEDLVRIFSNRLGLWGKLAFAFGIWSAVITSYVGGVTGYALAITDLCRTFVPGLKRDSASHSRDELTHDPLYRRLVAFFAFSPLYILYIPVRPVWLVLLANSAIVVVVPVVSLALLRMTSDRRVMGEHRNHWLTNAILLFVAAVSCYFIYRNGLDLWRKFA